MPDESAERELRRLAALAEALIAHAPAAQAALAPWQQEFAAASRIGDATRAGSHDPLAREQALDVLSLSLRRCWMSVAHAASDPLLKSPPLRVPKALPGGAPLEYSYERNLRPTPLEQRVAVARPRVDGWSADHVLFRSGMAALSTFLQSYVASARTASDAPLRLDMWGGYFETHVLLELLRGGALRWRRHSDPAELGAAIRAGVSDALLVEAVAYEWDLPVLDLQALVRDLLARPAGAAALVIVDTTLVGSSFPTAELLRALAPRPPPTVVLWNSGLKLDQEGLELANAGLLSLYTPAGATPAAPELAHLLRKMRTIVGTGLSLDEICLLDVPWFMDPVDTAHATAVFLHNALFAHAVPAGGLFRRVIHPALSREASRPWARAPFVVLHLAEDTLDCHGLLLAVVAHEARRRRLCLDMGSSFGFRGHRFEVIIPRLSEGRGLFKVAMGARAGPSRDGTIQLFAELAALRDFDEVRARWPGLKAVDLHDVQE